MRYAGTYLGTIQRTTGSRWIYGIEGATPGLSFELSQAIGGVRKQDIGKQVFRVGGVIQVENDEQRDRRLTAR